MAKRNIIFFPVFVIILLSALASCGEDRWAEYAPLTSMDEWMDSVMRSSYYWVEDMPASKKLNYFITPSTFLTAAKSDSDNVSYVDSTVATSNSYGITAKYVTKASNDTVYYAVVTYVDTNSPAATAGLKRGDWITKVGNDSITKSTYKSILASGNATKLTLGKYTTIALTDSTSTYTIAATDNVLTMGASGIVSDNPVHYYTTFTYNSKKIGYLVYSSFKAGSSDEYNNKLRTAFASFSSAGVDDVILDLRYNKGGEMGCAQLLATMLVPSSKIGSTFLTVKHNACLKAMTDETLTLDKSLIGSGANLNLSNVYIITTSATAQMAEILINALKPYMTVKTVGATTAGVRGVTTTFTNNPHNYKLHLVTGLPYNASGETYSTGISATSTATDSSTLSTLLDFGNTDETMLAAALALIAAK